MRTVASALVTLIALLHVYIMVLEMFFWTSPGGLKAFGNTLELAERTKVLAGNQGLYNGFLAAGLIWGVAFQDVSFQIFFLGCVMVAGAYGAATAVRRILFIQTLPAAVALALVLLSR
jgi:putative membrane protein